MTDAKVAIEYLGYLEGHNGWVTSLACTSDAMGKPVLVSGSRDKSVLVWKIDFENSQEIFDPEKADVVIDHKVGKPYKALKGHNHFVSSLSIARDGKHVVSASWDKTLRLWDLTTMTTRDLFTGHTKDVLSVNFSPDNRMIFSGGMDRTLRFWNTVGEIKFTHTPFKGWVSSITSIRKGKDSLLAVGSWDSKVRIFDNDLVFNRVIDGLDYGVVSMASDDEGDFLFVGQKNGTVKIWNLANEQNESDTLKQTIDTNADLNSFIFDSTYFQIITLATSKGLSFREIKGNAPFYEKNIGGNVACLSLAYDPSKKFLFAGYSDGKIRAFRMDKSERDI